MIQELQTGILDINNKYDIDFSCKQLDDIILKIIVYDKSLPADLSKYNVRLKAFKADQVPLIQNTNITIKDNFVTIKADKQLTTTNGIVKAELQFINKTTLEKKSTFYINIEVVASVLDVNGIVSTPTCTILEEIDHKLDQIENIGQVLDEAKDVRDTLTNTTIPGATNINSALVGNIKNADTKKKEVENTISNASNKISEVKTSIKNADSSKKELDLSKTNADISKENLDTANTLAEKNIEELNSLGNVTDLAKNVQTNTTDITKLKTDVENNTSQLKDCAKKTDLDNYYSLVNATKIATGTDILTLPFGNYVSTESEITETLVNCPTKGSGFVMKVERITGGIQGNFKRLNIKCNNKTSDTFINTLVDTQWSGWKQLATVDDTGWITLHLEGKVIAYESYQTPIYRKINNTVEIIGAIKDVTNFNTNNNVIFATLPTGFRSKKDFRILCQGSNKDSWLLTVTESGMLKGSRYGMNGLASSMDGTEWLPFHIVFTV
ncbi:viral A-type inclusion protein [Clostridium botulinum]|uniref:viral A-type inclusion protein n=1 Tax=Clostridium botulinum TaxID=1491 RepID=UPI001966F1A7|nr:viral A-type inclusion protein [Clostridium botulinum]